MGYRAMWKGVIGIGDLGVPVKLYSGVEDRNIHFRMLHEEDLVPVQQRMVHPDTGDEIPYSEALRGFETADGRMVVLDEEDLSALEPEHSREIEITRFVDSAALDHAWYDRPYHLGPDDGGDAYGALARALEETGRTGIARWVMRKKEYRGALRAHGGSLMLITLHATGEMISVSSLEAPEGRELQESEVEMAGKLVDALSGEFDPEAYENEHRARIMELIRAKEAGEIVEFPRHETRETREEDLTEALKASLAEARERKRA